MGAGMDGKRWTGDQVQVGRPAPALQNSGRGPIDGARGCWVDAFCGIRGVPRRRGRRSVRHGAFALVGARCASRASMGALGGKMSACTVFGWCIGPGGRAGERHALLGGEGRAGGSQNIKSSYSPVFRCSTPVLHAHTPSTISINAAPSASSLNGRAGGLLRHVVAVLLCVVRAGGRCRAGCRGRSEGGEKGGDGAAQGSPTDRRLARRRESEGEGRNEVAAR